MIPPPHTHRHRYHGVLAPNATLRAAVTALAQEASNDAQQQREKKDTEDAAEALWRSPARYLCAMLLARIYESAPLACPQCGADMRIIAFVTDGVSVRRLGRFAIPLRFEGQDAPSLARPLDGAKVHRTFVFSVLPWSTSASPPSPR